MKLYDKGEHADYVRTQRNRNLIHSDGLVERDADWEDAEKLVEQVQQHLPEDFSPKIVLVAGCRTGYELPILADTLETLVIGLDIVEEFVACASKRAPTICCDLHSIPLWDNTIDLTVCSGTLEHCYSPLKALSELARVTSGYAYITNDLEEDRNEFKSHYAFSTDVNEWLPLYVEAGFEVISAEVHEFGVNRTLRVFAKVR